VITALDEWAIACADESAANAVAQRRSPAGQPATSVACSVCAWLEKSAGQSKPERKILAIARVWELFKAPSNRLSSLSSETSRFLSQQSE
jgi:hypothetical protein